MGHKVHPTGFRLGVVKGWQSRWFAERDYKDILAEDFQIRRIINKELANAAVSRIEIERTAADQVLVKVFTAKPGIVIGKSGEKVDKLRAILETKTRKRRVRMDIVEIRQPELDAYLVGRSIAEQLEKRVGFRRAMKQAVQKSMRANAKGIKIIVGGRLGGAEIARTEKEVEGKVPLQTLRADIDYGQTEAHTTFGVIGIKVWIYRGDILPSKRREAGEALPEAVVQPGFTPRERTDRGERRGGERGDRRREGGQRGERPQGDRPPRPPRQPGDRPQGDRPPRPPRQQGDRPQGDRPPRPPRQPGDRPQGDRPPRPPRQQGDRPQGDRPPRPPRTEHAPANATPATPVSSESVEQSAPVSQPETTQTPPATPTTDNGTTGAAQSE